MSAVRMCDKCGTIFSEREDFSTGEMTRIVKNKETGRREAVVERADLCAACTNGETVVRPMIASFPQDPAPGQARTTVVDADSDPA